MRRRIRSISTVIAFLVATSSLAAHHYAAAIFDLDKKVTLTGTLTAIDWRNPHIEMNIDVKGADAGAWKVEGMAPNWFRTRNLTKANFDSAMGKTITVEGVRAKDGSQYALLQKLSLPDGSSVTTTDARTP